MSADKMAVSRRNQITPEQTKIFNPIIALQSIALTRFNLFLAFHFNLFSYHFSLFSAYYLNL